ncbi:MAG: DUF1499 domain-containing protein [Pseudohongiellaceae bacterium]
MSEQTAPQRNNATPLQKTMVILGIIALVAAVALAGLSLLAPMGVWLGLWDFRTGFAILRFANTWAAWVAVLGIGVGFLLLTAGRSPLLTSARRLGSWTLAAAVVVGIAWLIPQTYTPPEGTPPIHDISTDTANPPEFVAVLPLRGTDSNPVEYGTFGEMTPERQAGMQAEAYPEIQPRYFDATADEVFNRALQAVEAMGWELVDAAPEEGRIEATDTTFWFRFKDDVVIRIREEGDQTRLDARSTSRVGTSDVGKNAARLRAFFAEL